MSKTVQQPKPPDKPSSILLWIIVIAVVTWFWSRGSDPEVNPLSGSTAIAQVPSRNAQWEYAELSSGPGGTRWEDSKRVVEKRTLAEMCAELKVQPAYDASTALINGLAAQGWEVVSYEAISSVQGSATSIYTTAASVWLLRRAKT